MLSTSHTIPPRIRIIVSKSSYLKVFKNMLEIKETKMREREKAAGVNTPNGRGDTDGEGRKEERRSR